MVRTGKPATTDSRSTMPAASSSAGRINRSAANIKSGMSSCPERIVTFPERPSRNISRLNGAGLSSPITKNRTFLRSERGNARTAYKARSSPFFTNPEPTISIILSSSFNPRSARLARRRCTTSSGTTRSREIPGGRNCIRSSCVW